LAGNLNKVMQLPAIDVAVGLTYRSTGHEGGYSRLNGRGPGRRFLQPPMQESFDRGSSQNSGSLPFAVVQGPMCGAQIATNILAQGSVFDE
jgi:hypothetical protein